MMSTAPFWIPGPWRGRLPVVARPRGGDWLEDEARGWRRAGIDLVVSLLESDEAADLDLLEEREAAEANAVRFISFPIPDRRVPASRDAAVALMAALASDLAEGSNVAVHCRQGIGRSGLFTAGLLTLSGVSPEQAIATVSAARGVTVPETPEQLSWVHGLPSGRLAVSR